MTNRKGDYEKIRMSSLQVASQAQQNTQYYQNFKDIYTDAVFPPTYFVIGAYNSGGTSSKNGLIIGVEMQTDKNNIPYIVAHELIHFNQNHPNRENTLLEQAITEGAADFIGELISGKHINEATFAYGNADEEMLCREFAGIIMYGKNYHGWLYGGIGKEPERPNDLGYWMGYQICKAYYEKAKSKKTAVADILTIADFKDFLKSSGYLAAYQEN